MIPRKLEDVPYDVLKIEFVTFSYFLYPDFQNICQSGTVIIFG
jgi:hypothetical protein